jgi:NarL family two-component system response regulator LiaR
MSTEQPIRVLIVDDHMMVRRGLAAVFQVSPGIELVGQAQDGREAIELCEARHPDVVLMDLVMPGMTGPEATREIRQKWPAIKVVALTSFEEKDLVQEALRAGAISYLLKNVGAQDLVDAIREAHQGHARLSPEIAESLIQVASGEPPPGSDLTPREREVLALLVEGLTNREIAQRLVISLSTARAHVSNILSKLEVTNRVEAVSLAMREGLVS